MRGGIRPVAVFLALWLAAACGPGSSKPMRESGFRVAFEEHDVPARMVAGETVSPTVVFTNISDVTWPSRPDFKQRNAVNLSYHWLDRRGRMVVFDGLRTPLPADVPPGETVKLKAAIQAPQRQGRHTLEITLVQEGVAWFPERDGEKLTIAVNVVRSG